MLCEKCKTKMLQIYKNSVQGWSCPVCGWNIVTTHIDKIYQDRTEYSVYIKKTNDIGKDKIKVISKITGANYIVARKILMQGNICILKAKAVDIKSLILELNKVEILYEIIPEFNY